MCDPSVYVVQCAIIALNAPSHTQLGFALFPTRNWTCSLTRSCSPLPTYLGLFPSRILTAFSMWLSRPLFWFSRSWFWFTSLPPLLLIGQDRTRIVASKFWEVHTLCVLFPSSFWLPLLASQTSRFRMLICSSLFRIKFMAAVWLWIPFAYYSVLGIEISLMCPGFGPNLTRYLEPQSMKSSCVFYLVWAQTLTLHSLELGFENEFCDKGWKWLYKLGTFTPYLETDLTFSLL